MTAAAHIREDAAALARLQQDLRRIVGFDAASLGEKVFERAVRMRMTDLRLDHVEEYLQLVQHSQEHWMDLVESVLVTETWFFRDPEVFCAFGRVAAEEWLPNHRDDRLRVLSLACASGEEPFSAVMALLETGLPPARFQVDAIDVCRRPIACARKAAYGNNSFRGQNLEFRDKYFDATAPGQFALQPRVRDQVRLYEGNLVGEDFPLGQHSYDFVFCRNLLIYFDPPAQQKALRKIEQLLAPSGLLFVSPAEQGVVLGLGFQASQLPRAFSCPAPQPALCTARADPHWLGQTDCPATVPVAKEDTGNRPSRQANCESFLRGAEAAAPLADLDQIRRLADAGCLEEAAGACEDYVRHCRACAEGYYLLGLLREAQEDARALESYRRALYLKPDYYEVLSHMALLAQRNGDPVGARNFRRRAERNQPPPL
jgi:chemotaxis protein methyltransferase WspC